MIDECVLRCKSDYAIHLACVQHFHDALIYRNCTTGVLSIFAKPNQAMLKARFGRYEAHKNVDVQRTVVDGAEMLSFKQKSSSPRMLIRNGETEPLFGVVDLVIDYCDRGGYVKEIPSDIILRASKTESWYDALSCAITPYNLLPPLKPVRSGCNESNVVRLMRVLRRRFEPEVSLPLTECPLESKHQGVANAAFLSGMHHKPAMYPKYLDQNERLYSFATWRWPSLDRIHLANIGFFYTGNGDLIRCCVCGIGLKDLQPGDDVMKEHIRYSGDCGFLVQLFGPGRLQQKLKELAVEDPFYAGYHQNVPASSKTGYSQPQQNTVLPSERTPRMRTLEARLNTFFGWPRTRTHTPFQVAEAGFFYTGDRDIVRCWSCDGGLKDWDPNDDPWIEHCRWFPGCTFARQTKGDQYIQLVQQTLKAGQQESNVDQLVGKLSNLTTNEADDQITRQLLEMGFQHTQIQAAFTMLAERGMRTPALDSVLDTIEANEA